MAQTATADSARNAKVEISADGTVWVDIGGTTTSVAVTGGARQTGESSTPRQRVKDSRRHAPFGKVPLCCMCATHHSADRRVSRSIRLALGA
jgi:hypothetical protein